MCTYMINLYMHQCVIFSNLIFILIYFFQEKWMSSKEALAEALKNISALNNKSSLLTYELSSLQQKYSEIEKMTFEDIQSLR
jgi:hypothetical protein